MFKSMLVLGFGLVALIAFPAHARPDSGGGGDDASSISTTINLGTVYTGDLPSGAAPWLKAEFSSTVGASTGTLTITSGLTGTEKVQGLESSKAAVGLAFHLTQAVNGIGYVSGTQAQMALYASSFNAGPVPGAYNLAFGWSSGNTFGAGDQVVYTLNFTGPLTNDPFKPNEDGWAAVAHIQDIDGSSCSGWIVAGNGDGADGGTPCATTHPSVPEPAGLGVFGFGVLLVGAFVGLRRRVA